MSSAQLSILDRIVSQLAHVLISNSRFRSLCETSLLRYDQSVFLRQLTVTFIVLAKSIHRDAPKLVPVTTNLNSGLLLIRDKEDARDSHPDRGTLDRATAWMLRECRTIVALKLCELVNLESRSLDVLVARTLEGPLAFDDSRLTKFLGDRFKKEGEYLSGVYDELVMKNGDELFEDENSIDSGDIDGPPDTELFDDVSDQLMQDIICSGSAFGDAYRKLRGLISPVPADMIRKVLRKCIIDDGDVISIVCIIDWRLLEYFQQEELSVDDMQSVFTLNGELETAYAARLGDYMLQTWETGEETLNLIKSLLRKRAIKGSKNGSSSPITETSSHIDIQLFPSSANTVEQAYVKVTGSLDEIGRYLEQLAWLTVTLRPHIDGELTVSDINFRAKHIGSADSSARYYDSAYFHLSLFDHEQSIKADSSMPGQCWTSIWTESVLAHRFSLLKPRRPAGAVGLEAPFDIMTAFAGVKYPLLIKEHVVFANSTRVLIPETKLPGDCIQWHFHRSRNWIDEVLSERSARWDSRLETLNLPTLTRSRAFLGYCKVSSMLLGTAEFEHVDATESEVPRVSKVSFQQPEHSFQIIIDGHGRGRAGDGSSWKFNHGETALIQTHDINPEYRMQKLMTRSALLYDQETCVASLVPELSLILQLVVGYLRTDSKMKRMMIPVAKPSAEGSHAAYETVVKYKDLIVPLTKFPPRRYIDVVAQFLDIVEQRRTQTYIRTRYNDSFSNEGLQGWDHADLQALKFEISERGLRLKPPASPPIWWQLFQNTSTLVLFTRLSKIPIRKAKIHQGNFDCKAWDELPRGNHILFLTMPQLERLKADICWNPRRFSTRYMLNCKISWARPVDSRIFETNCKKGGSCNPLQALIDMDSHLSRSNKAKPRDNKSENGSDYYHHPGPIQSEGAVVFCDDPSLFEHRACWGESSRMPRTRTERDYVFISISILAFVLVYWNFRFLLFVMAICGLVYVLY